MIDKREIRDLYSSGLSTRQVSKLTGTSFGYVHKLCRDITRNRIDALRLAQPPKSTHWRSARVQARRVWERNVGPIPKGFHIHHKDGNFTNNNLNNLECLEAVEHAFFHHPKNPIPRHLRPERKAYMKKYLAEYRRKRVS